jgi:hypothetical protein
MLGYRYADKTYTFVLILIANIVNHIFKNYVFTLRAFLLCHLVHLRTCRRQNEYKVLAVSNHKHSTSI